MSGIPAGRHRRTALVALGLGLAAACGSVFAAEPFRPKPGEFPPLQEAKPLRGELVFVDHVNRRGSLRLQIDGHFAEGRPHHFAMLPYGMIFYRGAPAELRDIPIGTVLYGRFFLPPDPNTSAVPVVKAGDVTAPPENHALLLEDGPSQCLREGRAWKLESVEIKDGAGQITASLDRQPGPEGPGGRQTFTIDRSTRVWRGREQLGLDDLVAEGGWPAEGSKDLAGQPVQLCLGWHPRYLYQQFHVADIWLDDKAVEVARERQRQRHIRHIHTRWMPARVDAVEHGRFGRATISATLFGGMDPSLYAEFKPGIGGKMASAEDTLRTWWQDHDGMDGRIVGVDAGDSPPLSGASGVRIRFEVPLILEGFRPGRVVRVRPQSWPNITPPSEERVRGLDDRWPSVDVFRR
jgi:hypothetical protein